MDPAIKKLRKIKVPNKSPALPDAIGARPRKNWAYIKHNSDEILIRLRRVILSRESCNNQQK